MITQNNASSQLLPSMNTVLDVHQEGFMPPLNEVDKGNHFTTPPQIQDTPLIHAPLVKAFASPYGQNVSMTHHVPLVHTYVAARIQRLSCLDTDPYGETERDVEISDNEVMDRKLKEL